MRLVLLLSLKSLIPLSPFSFPAEERSPCQHAAWVEILLSSFQKIKNAVESPPFLLKEPEIGRVMEKQISAL